MYVRDFLNLLFYIGTAYNYKLFQLNFFIICIILTQSSLKTKNAHTDMNKFNIIFIKSVL